ncbi:MAG: GAF domain-containing protein [Ignavibacterium sp.]|nr:MAG: GAF domain-containing protein [Ignavibacterium sp.]
MKEIVSTEHIESEEGKYKLLLKQVKELLSTDDDELSNLSNLTAAINQTFDKVSWVGFYLFKDKKLILGPFQGKVACTEIEIGKGVCGTAAEKRETIIVEDVNKFPGHIFCDADSKSEIVVPIIKSDGLLYGVLDLDSSEYNSFNNVDKQYLEEICKFLAKEIFT